MNHIPMTQVSKEKRQKMIDLQTKLYESGELSSCVFCENWDNKNEICKQWNAKPPANVVIVGCIEYLNRIPF